MDRKSDAQRVADRNVTSPSVSRLSRRDKKRRGKVNLLNFLLRGRLRNVSGVVLAMLGIVAVGAVILLLVALIAFVVRRSNDSLDWVATPSVTPAIVENTPAATTLQVSPTVMPHITETPTVMWPTPTEESLMAPGQYVQVTGTGVLGLRLRSEPGLNAATTDVAAEQSILKILAGPQQVDDIEWWQLESSDGIAGWAAGDFLVLTAEPAEGWN